MRTLPIPPQAHPDRVLARTDLVTIGAFRCPVDHPLFKDSGPTEQACVVFPRTSVTIEHDDGAPFLADATLATLYNEGQRYARRAVSAEGDRCDWYGVASSVLRDVTRHVDASTDDAPRPIRHERAPVGRQLYRRQRRFFHAVGNGEIADPLAIEETTLALVGEVLTLAYTDAARPRAGRITAGRVALATAARELVAREFTAPLSLSQLSSTLDCSPFHLCRSFRAVTGMTLHGYQTDLRLRAALEAIEDGMSLTDVALEVGFSSHSHFTHAFHRAFGVTPSRALASLPTRRAGERRWRTLLRTRSQ